MTNAILDIRGHVLDKNDQGLHLLCGLCQQEEPIRTIVDVCVVDEESREISIGLIGLISNGEYRLICSKCRESKDVENNADGSVLDNMHIDPDKDSNNASS